MLYCNFHYLILVTIRKTYPLPRIDKCLCCLSQAECFTKLDTVSVFWHIALKRKNLIQQKLTVDVAFLNGIENCMMYATP